MKILSDLNCGEIRSLYLFIDDLLNFVLSFPVSFETFLEL